MLLPVVRGRYDNKVFYVSVMTYQQIADYVEISDVAQEHDAGKEIDSDYPEPLLPSVNSENPSWHEMPYSQSEGEKCDGFGLLEISGNTVLKPVNDTCRVIRIKELVGKDESLAGQQVPVMLVAGEIKK